MAQYFWHFNIIRFPLYSFLSNKMQENKRMIDHLNKFGDGVDEAASLEKAHNYSIIHSGEF
jgi:hypothetical protein